MYAKYFVCQHNTQANSICTNITPEWYKSFHSFELIITLRIDISNGGLMIKIRNFLWSISWDMLWQSMLFAIGIITILSVDNHVDIFSVINNVMSLDLMSIVGQPKLLVVAIKFRQHYFICCTTDLSPLVDPSFKVNGRRPYQCTFCRQSSEYLESSDRIYDPV